MREWQLMHEMERTQPGRDKRLSQRARLAHLVAQSRQKTGAQNPELAEHQAGVRRAHMRWIMLVRKARRLAAAAVLVASLVVWLIEKAA